MRVLAAAFLACLALPAAGQTIRLAAFNASLTRDGPGLLLKDILDGDDSQILAVVEIIQRTAPDILVINEFDYDLNGEALAQFINLLAVGQGGAAGQSYSFSTAGPVNSGLPSGHDLDGDGKVGWPRDAFGYGEFPGQEGMVVLSKYPIAAVRSFRLLRWVDAPFAILPTWPDGDPFPSAEAQAVMRLSSTAHWDVAIDLPWGRFHTLVAHPTPTVFDGPENANGLRNRDEIRFWSAYLDGQPVADDAGDLAAFAGEYFAVMGTLNADPFDGERLEDGIDNLLTHRLVQDPRPTSEGAVLAARDQGGWNERQLGRPGEDTADWNDATGPGNLRADYVLPASALKVTGAGVFWPTPEEPIFHLIGTDRSVSSDHRLVWVDVSPP